MSGGNSYLILGATGLIGSYLYEKLKLYEDAGYYLHDGLIATFSGKKIDEREFELRVFSIIRGLLI